MNRLLVVLDLDETLIHATTKEDLGEPDFDMEGWKVYKRPHLNRFLDYCFEHFDVAVWTSAGELFADGIVTQIMPSRALKFVWSAERCTQHFNSETLEYYPRKLLKKICRRGWSANRIVAIDDTPSKWEASYGNYVQVLPFFGDRTDRELLDLQEYLSSLISVESVREIDKRNWRTQVEKSEQAEQSVPPKSDRAGG